MQFGGYFETGYYVGYGQQYPGNRMGGYSSYGYSLTNSNMPPGVHPVCLHSPTLVNLLTITNSAQLKEISEQARELAR